MSYFHVVATLAGGSTKAVTNRTEADVLTDFVIPFVTDSTITTTWGNDVKTRQALELKIYATETAHNRSAGETLEELIRGKRNRFRNFETRARTFLARSRNRVFIIMPIQGARYGEMEQQRIFEEYDDRFSALEDILDELGCVAIRIDKEAPLEGLVERIKTEIQRAQFVICDLTDERPSCYYELGYADALLVPAICVASTDSVMTPSVPTKIHFDVHRQVQMFTNHRELKEKVKHVFDRNREALLASRVERATDLAA